MGRVTYGDHTYGKIRVTGRRDSSVSVGRYCSIGQEVRAFMEDDHSMENISTYPFGHPGMPISRTFDLDHRPDIYRSNLPLEIKVGNDVWIGYGSVLFRGVTIGDGAVIGAFTKVTKDIPPYAVVVGHSRIIRKRFPDDDIAFLLWLRWWDFDDETVAEIVPILHGKNIESLRKWAREKSFG
jgi:virginiamycin A acetyltransferase